MLTNRQPTLHKPGMMGHRARVMRCEQRAVLAVVLARWARLTQGRAGLSEGANMGHVSLLIWVTPCLILAAHLINLIVAMLLHSC